MERLAYGDRTYTLRRYPLKKGDRLRAWDAADEYLLRYVTENDLGVTGGRMLLVNDAFGALAVALHQYDPFTWGDSYLARQALRFNRYENRLPGPEPTFVSADASPLGPCDVALIKLPKSLAFFEDQLRHLRRILAPEAQVITGGMIKHTPKRAFELLTEVIGPTRTTLGWKKARLAHSRVDADTVPVAAVPGVSYRMPDTDFELRSLPNVFSREKPDVGTRLLLAHLPRHERELTAIDLGCGNGILAIALARTCPEARILGVDESYQAIASARLNAADLGADAGRLKFRVDEGLTTEADSSFDLVVCNPPFHQGQATGDLPAWTMFADARRVLSPGGELRVVGNRHLGYHAKLKRLFDQVDLVAADARFVVLAARRSPATP